MVRMGECDSKAMAGSAENIMAPEIGIEREAADADTDAGALAETALVVPNSGARNGVLSSTDMTPVFLI
jgi:hypothetical protein